MRTPWHAIAFGGGGCASNEVGDEKESRYVMNINELTGEVIGAAIEVHKHLGPGLLESTYEACLCRELELRKIKYERQKDLPITYKGVSLECGYRLDLFVDNQLIIELKVLNSIENIHKAQLLTYLKLTEIEVGLLINFNVPVLKEGITRLINSYADKRE